MTMNLQQQEPQKNVDATREHTLRQPGVPGTGVSNRATCHGV